MMRTMGPLLMGIAVAVLAAAARACEGGGTPGYGPGVFADVKTDRSSYAVGQPVKISLVVKNHSDKPVTYHFSSAKQFDVWVEKDGREIWRHSRGLMYIQVLTHFTIPPNGSKTFTVTWKQLDSDGHQLPSGPYTVKARITPTNEAKVAAVTAPITVSTSKTPKR